MISKMINATKWNFKHKNIVINRKCVHTSKYVFMEKTLSFIIALLFVWNLSSANTSSILVEAESFTRTGGWVLDQQSIDQIGSTYLLAHGLGNPCADAETSISFPNAGEYHVWVRTREWSTTKSRQDAPGKFQVLINNVALDTIFGVQKPEWNWQYGGKVKLAEAKLKVALHDLTGFEGRCDAIILSTNKNLIEHQSLDPLLQLRKKLSKSTGKVHQISENYDLVVVGGGIAGITTSLTAARLGLKVALVHNRPVLGGNNSSEIKVPMAGDLNMLPYEHLGDITRELHPKEKSGISAMNDMLKLDLILAEKNIDLYLETHVFDAFVKSGKIREITARNIQSNEEFTLEGALFADCTGDGNLGFLASADYKQGRESKAETGETLAPENPDSLVLGATLHWASEKANQPVPFPECPWALHFTEENCQNATAASWNWETGFQYDMVNNAEFIRDHMFRAIYGNWAYQKNFASNKEKYKNYKLNSMGYILGKRESRRLLGDYIFSENDIREGIELEDACVPSRWGIDLHYPDPKNSKYFPQHEFRSVAFHEKKQIHPVCLLPYRSLYSHNISNLFMAGRCVSMTHIAHAMFRVQNTTGMMGEVVGMAAFIATKNKTTPRGVYHSHLEEFKMLLATGIKKKISFK